MELLRYQLWLTYGAVILAVWQVVLSKREEWSSQVQPSIWLAVEWLPATAIVMLGLYAFIRLIVGVATFRDCPEAAAELELQVKEAKRELKARGIIS